MIVLWCTCACVCLLLLSFEIAHAQPIDVSYTRQRIEGPLTFHRRRRTAKIIGEAVLSGLRATKQLLKRANLNQERDGFEVYDKMGGNIQALKDFYSVKPKAVQDLPSGAGKMGFVGDRQIQYIRGNPFKTLPFITIKKGEQYFPEHIIVYADKISDKPL